MAPVPNWHICVYYLYCTSWQTNIHVQQ